jgi:hypothetical protein
VQRHREIAASPQRTTADTWTTIRMLIADTLEQSSSIDRLEVDEALEPLEQVGRMLVAGGHLEQDPLTLVAAKMFLEIATVSGTRALTLEENLRPVAGTAGAADWTLYVPQVEPMAKLVRAAVKGCDHLSADAPAAAVPASTASSRGVDFDAAARWARVDR